MAILDPITNWFAERNERERQLLIVMAVVAALIVLVLPLYLMGSAISDIEDENTEIAAVLREIGNSRASLAQREAESEAARSRYANPAPPLGSFVEARAGEQELTLREVTDQPEKVIGEFTRRHVRATIPNVGLRPTILMLADIENSPYPVALEKIKIEHFRAGDRYNVQLGLIAYDSNDETEAPAGEGPGEGRAGPRRPR